MHLTAKERLAARKAEVAELEEANDEAKAEQELEDLEAIEKLRVEHGRSNVAVVEVPFTPGLPVLIATRCATPVEVKKFQDRLREDKPDHAAAAREVGAVCRVYPDADTWANLIAARPIVAVQAGTAALTLASGKIREAGKG
jgi:hypothetical protein